MFEHLTPTMSVPATKDKDNKDITSTEEYQASLVAYQEWCKKDCKVRYTMLYCMMILFMNLTFILLLKITRTLLILRSIKRAWLRTKNGARKIVRYAILCCIA